MWFLQIQTQRHETMHEVELVTTRPPRVPSQVTFGFDKKPHLYDPPDRNANSPSAQVPTNLRAVG
jgi:hypothetical protein